MYRIIWVVAFLATGGVKRQPHSNAQSQQTRDNHPILFQWRASVEDVGPTLKQYWVDGTCFVGCWRDFKVE